MIEYLDFKKQNIGNLSLVKLFLKKKFLAKCKHLYVIEYSNLIEHNNKLMKQSMKYMQYVCDQLIFNYKRKNIVKKINYINSSIKILNTIMDHYY